MSQEKRAELKLRKFRKKLFNEWLKQPEKPQLDPNSPEQQRLRDIALKIHNEDYPHNSSFSEDIDLWNSGIFPNESTSTPDKDSSLPCEQRLEKQLDKEIKRLTKN
jgi:hypothetical protein